MRQRIIILCLLVMMVFSQAVSAQEFRVTPYDIGTPTLTEVWVDPVNGDNLENSGTSPEDAFWTLNHAWNQIPIGETLTTGVAIHLLPGTYTGDMIPSYWETRYGTAEAPIIIDAPQGGVTIPIVNLFDTTYLYLMNFTIEGGGGDVFHCERCDHLLLRGMTIRGIDPENQGVQETVKINQSQHIYIEDSDISGAIENAVDYVAVQYGHVLNTRLHDAEDWCMYAKGGSANLLIQGNTFYDCGTGGFTAGQGTGFEFMTPPWLTYEAENIVFMDNVVHDTWGAAVGVNGGRNILIIYNVFYRVGERSHGIEVVYGLRTCDGNRERCGEYLAQGGWGTAEIGVEEPIPNQQVYIYNNVLYNPPGFQSEWEHFAIHGLRSTSAGSNIPDPALADDELYIRGNLIWNGPADFPLTEEGTGCQDDHPTCNPGHLRADNTINTLEPRLVDPENGDYRVVQDLSWERFVIPTELFQQLMVAINEES